MYLCFEQSDKLCNIEHHFIKTSFAIAFQNPSRVRNETFGTKTPELPLTKSPESYFSVSADDSSNDSSKQVFLLFISLIAFPVKKV